MTFAHHSRYVHWQNQLLPLYVNKSILCWCLESNVCAVNRSHRIRKTAVADNCAFILVCSAIWECDIYSWYIWLTFGSFHPTQPVYPVLCRLSHSPDESVRSLWYDPVVMKLSVVQYLRGLGEAGLPAMSRFKSSLSFGTVPKALPSGTSSSWK